MLELAKKRRDLPRLRSRILAPRYFELVRSFIEPRDLDEQEDLNKTPIDGVFYDEELTPVRISKRTVYQIDKILKQRRRRGILEYLVSWRCYHSSFDCWVPASEVKDIAQT
jgi:hypothetical protein